MREERYLGVTTFFISDWMDLEKLQQAERRLLARRHSPKKRQTSRLPSAKEKPLKEGGLTLSRD